MVVKRWVDLHLYGADDTDMIEAIQTFATSKGWTVENAREFRYEETQKTDLSGTALTDGEGKALMDRKQELHRVLEGGQIKTM